MPASRVKFGMRIVVSSSSSSHPSTACSAGSAKAGVNPAGDSAEEVRGQTRDTHPRQDQEATLLGDLVRMRLAHRQQFAGGQGVEMRLEQGAGSQRELP